MRQFLVARIDEEISSNFHVKSWRVSFYATNKSCPIRKLARVKDSSHKIWQIPWAPLEND